MTPHLQHPSRAQNRPLRPGDRVKYIGPDPIQYDPMLDPYPGAAIFGVVYKTDGVLHHVRWDDRSRSPQLADELERL